MPPFLEAIIHLVTMERVAMRLLVGLVAELAGIPVLAGGLDLEKGLARLCTA